MGFPFSWICSETVPEIPLFSCDSNPWQWQGVIEYYSLAIATDSSNFLLGETITIKLQNEMMNISWL